jgi:hypothetical protein
VPVLEILAIAAAIAAAAIAAAIVNRKNVNTTFGLLVGNRRGFA